METVESMDIREYLFTKDMTLENFSKILDCHPGYMSRVKRKAVKPGRKLARHIEKATEGAVKADYLLNDIEYKK